MSINLGRFVFVITTKYKNRLLYTTGFTKHYTQLFTTVILPHQRIPTKCKQSANYDWC